MFDNLNNLFNYFFYTRGYTALIGDSGRSLLVLSN